MKFKLSGKTDVYLEIADRFQEYIDKGIYKSGDKLPSVRQVAVDIGVNPNTVARAYSILEERKIIHTLPKKGVYVSEITVSPVKSSPPLIKQEIEKWKNEGICENEIIRLIKEVYEND